MSGAVLLLSGGLDSTTVASIVSRDGMRVVALTIDYGQRHSRELEAARKVAAHYAFEEHMTVSLNMTGIGGSALTDMSIGVPEPGGEGIPSTYVPARNTVFLSLALALAEARDCDSIYIGANAVDYSGYPDCRPEYIEAFNRMAALAVKRGIEGRPIKVEAPLVQLSKADIIKLGTGLAAPYALSWSCYRGGQKACGRCDSCSIRRRGFHEAGLEDPLEYED